jgi:hypothetical protein
MWCHTGALYTLISSCGIWWNKTAQTGKNQNRARNGMNHCMQGARSSPYRICVSYRCNPGNGVDIYSLSSGWCGVQLLSHNICVHYIPYSTCIKRKQRKQMCRRGGDTIDLSSTKGADKNTFDGTISIGFIYRGVTMQVHCWWWRRYVCWANPLRVTWCVDMRARSYVATWMCWWWCLQVRNRSPWLRKVRDTDATGTWCMHIPTLASMITDSSGALSDNARAQHGKKRGQRDAIFSYDYSCILQAGT